MGAIMSEYMVFFYTKVSAKSEKDVNRKAEQVGNVLSKALHKKVVPHGYVEVKKGDKIKQTTLD